MDKLRGGTGRGNVGQMPLFACVRLEETPFGDGEVIKPSERSVSGDCMDAALRPQTAPSVVFSLCISSAGTAADIHLSIPFPTCAKDQSNPPLVT